MGACFSSCLGHRNPANSSAEGESRPLLFEDAAVSYYANGEEAAHESLSKHQEDLSQIVQSTHDHFIDVTTFLQPDLEAPSSAPSPRKALPGESIGESLQWKWPELRPLTESEEKILAEMD